MFHLFMDIFIAPFILPATSRTDIENALPCWTPVNARIDGIFDTAEVIWSSLEFFAILQRWFYYTTLRPGFHLHV